MTLALDGSIYYTAQGDGGGLFKISYSARPVITHRPANQSAAIGGSATFIVRATSAATLSYRWQRNDGADGAFINVTGATRSSLTLDDLDATDNDARFRVVVIAAGEKTYSKAATLTVRV